MVGGVLQVGQKDNVSPGDVTKFRRKAFLDRRNGFFRLAFHPPAPLKGGPALGLAVLISFDKRWFLVERKHGRKLYHRSKVSPRRGRRVNTQREIITPLHPPQGGT